MIIIIVIIIIIIMIMITILDAVLRIPFNAQDMWCNGEKPNPHIFQI